MHPFTTNDMKQLTKSPERILAGVCGGIADFFGISPTWVRTGYAVLTCCSIAFPGILFYLLFTCIMPKSNMK